MRAVHIEAAAASREKKENTITHTDLYKPTVSQGLKSDTSINTNSMDWHKSAAIDPFSDLDPVFSKKGFT